MKNKKIFAFILLSALLILLPIISAKNIEVLIEHKNQNNLNLKSIKSLNENKFEIKSVTEEEFENLKKDNSILVQENIPKHIFLDVSVPLIEANKTWTLQENLTNITGEGETVCIIDTGAQTNHPALLGKNATCNIDCVGKSCRENCSLSDENGHGTHVAGIIVSSDSNVRGVTQNTKYIPVMVCSSSGSCASTDTLNGLYWCIQNKNTYNISVISMSLGTNTSYSSYCDASFSLDAAVINNATQNNISVVVATGNEANYTGISEPACIQNSIRVGNTYSRSYPTITWVGKCTDTSVNPDDFVCSGNRASFFSDIILAPGALINSTWNNLGFKSEGGTSMSTPHVSGTIALLNQYKKLESNTSLTPNETKNLILNSGKKIYDSETITNYTRINAYQLILFADEESPNITYMSPENNTLLEPINQNFTCNATDNLQFKNLTIKIYNSTSLIFNESTTNNYLIINYTLSLGNYNWSCVAIDNQSNEITQTYFINVNPIYIEQISPTNNTYTNENETEFNCSIESTKNLSNITIYIFNSTSLLYNETKNISGLNNYSIFEYNLTNEEKYYWNCYGENNESNNYSGENYTLTYDKTAPSISLIYPENNFKTTTKTLTFSYSESETNKDYCNLSINNILYSSFTQTLIDGIYTWKISCTDLGNNSAYSETFNLEIYSVSSGGGGGGGTNSVTPKIYEIKDSSVQLGTTQKIKEKESIKFKIKSENHNITLNKIEKDKVNITLESTPKIIILYLNSPTKINFDDDETFDLELILLESDSYATIFIKEINEAVPVKHILNESENKTENIESKEIENKSFFKQIKEIIKIIINYLLNRLK